jgi:hypothetical protein
MEQKPRSLILSSGTLSPLELIEKELGVEFHWKLTNDHVISEDQIKIFGISEYQQLDIEKYIKPSRRKNWKRPALPK